MQQTTANLIGFSTDVEKLYRCQQLNQDISELFNLADQALFSSL